MTSAARTTALLTAANVAVYCVLLGAWLLGGIMPEGASRLAALLSLPWGWQAVAEHPWTPLSYMFTHVSFIHLAVNMLWFIAFGAATGCTTRRVLICYLAGGLTGALLFELLPLQGTLAGASAGVIAVVVCGAVCFPDRRMNFMFFTEVRIKWLALTAVAVMAAGSLADVASAVAHAGGLAAGALCGLMIRLRMRRRSYVALGKARNEARRQALLQKTRLSGFASLSEAERLELFNLSARYPS